MLESTNREFMMLRINRAAARVRAPAPRPVEIILSTEDRRRFADFIMLLDAAERRSGVINNERKKVKLSKIRDGPISRGLFYFLKQKLYGIYRQHKKALFFVAIYAKTTIAQQYFLKVCHNLFSAIYK